MNCIIVDDEPIARQGMSDLIEKKTKLSLKGRFRNTTEAAAFLTSNAIDLVFLDVEMPGVNGLDFARTLSPRTLVIFTTAYAHYALKSYEVDAIDYLVKPIREERFLRAVNKAEQFNHYLSDGFEKSRFECMENAYIFIRADRLLHKIPLCDILYIEGMKDYVVINLKDRKLITAMNIRTTLTRLPSDTFKRISKSYIVNIEHVTALGNHVVYLKDIELPLGLAYRDDFFDDFTRHRPALT